MTEQDIKNREIILSIVKKNVGFEKSSFEFFRRQLLEPIIDKEFGEVDTDFRKTWDIDIYSFTEEQKKRLSQTDRAYSIFKDNFNSFINDITYQEFLDNMVERDKRKIKIKKYIEDIYKRDTKRFFQDFYSRHFYVPSVNEMDKYIKNAMENIGVYKFPRGNLKLVLSFNFADWLLCSTAESWSSCVSLENNYYAGLFPLIGDLSRGLLYITDGTKKEFLDIKVHKILSRSWVILSESLRKNIIKFYPSQILSVETIREITKDNNYINAEHKSTGEQEKSKNDYVPLFFEKGVTITPYNDRSTLLSGNKKLVQHITGTPSGLQTFNIFLEKISERPFYPIFSKSFKQIVKENLSINNLIDYEPLICSICQKAHKNLTKINSKSYCPECIKELKACQHCNKHVAKEEITIINDKELCKKCVPLYKIEKCDICQKEHFAKDFKSINLYGTIKKVCSDHSLVAKKCLGCKEQNYDFTFVRLHDVNPKQENMLLGKWRCRNCFEKIKDNYKKCSICNEYFNLSKLKNDICPNCAS